MPKEHPKMYQKVVNMAPTWAQVGAMLGSKIVLDTSKSDTEKNIKKQKSASPKTAPGGGAAPTGSLALAQFSILSRTPSAYQT